MRAPVLDDRNRQAHLNCKTFTMLPKRWIVERTLARISHNRRLISDYRALRADLSPRSPVRHDQTHAATLDQVNCLNMSPKF
jgi:transposase